MSLMNKMEDYITIKRDEDASRRCGLGVKYFAVGDNRVSSLVILQKKNSTHYAVEIGIGMTYVQGGWTVKKRLAYWDNSQPVQPEKRPQGWAHEGQEAWCMGTLHSSYGINAELVSWFCSPQGRLVNQEAMLEEAQYHSLKIQMIQEEQRVQKALWDMVQEIGFV